MNRGGAGVVRDVGVEILRVGEEMANHPVAEFRFVVAGVHGGYSFRSLQNDRCGFPCFHQRALNLLPRGFVLACDPNEA